MTDISVAAIVANANAAFEAKKGAAGLKDARNVFDGALLELVDEISEEEESLIQTAGPLPEGVFVDSATEDVSSLKKTLRKKRRIVCDLWIKWAELEKGKKQWKQVVKVFDQACECKVASPMPLVWRAYAAFCVEREKFSNAQKHLSRALAAIKTNRGVEAVLGDFLALKRNHLDEPQLSMDGLKEQLAPILGARPQVPDGGESEEEEDEVETPSESRGSVHVLGVETAEDKLRASLEQAQASGAVVDVANTNGSSSSAALPTSENSDHATSRKRQLELDTSDGKDAQAPVKVKVEKLSESGNTPSSTGIGDQGDAAASPSEWWGSGGEDGEAAAEEVAGAPPEDPDEDEVLASETALPLLLFDVDPGCSAAAAVLYGGSGAAADQPRSAAAQCFGAGVPAAAEAAQEALALEERCAAAAQQVSWDQTISERLDAFLAFAQQAVGSASGSEESAVERSAGAAVVEAMRLLQELAVWDLDASLRRVSKSGSSTEAGHSGSQGGCEAAQGGPAAASSAGQASLARRRAEILKKAQGKLLDVRAAQQKCLAQAGMPCFQGTHAKNLAAASTKSEVALSEVGSRSTAGARLEKPGGAIPSTEGATSGKVALSRQAAVLRVALQKIYSPTALTSSFPTPTTTTAVYQQNTTPTSLNPAHQLRQLHTLKLQPPRSQGGGGAFTAGPKRPGGGNSPPPSSTAAADVKKLLSALSSAKQRKLGGASE